MYQEKELEINGRKYIISNDGHVFFGEKTLHAKYHQEVTQYLNQDGYKAVTVGKTHKRVRRCVHQLVAICFLDKPNDGKRYEIDHIDRNRTNNNVENLRYVTHVENVKLIPKRVRHEVTHGENNGRATFTWEDVDQIREWYKQGYTITEISRKVYGQDIPYKYKWNTISHIVKNETWVRDTE